MKKLRQNKWFTMIVIPVLLVLVSGAFVVKNVSEHTQISPVDEYVYLDYVAKIPEQGIVPLGSETGDTARNYLACQGVAGYGVFDPNSCETKNHENDSLYPYEGINSADIYTPIYFAVAWVVSQPIEALTGADFLTSARLSGAIWAAGTAVLMYFSLRRLGLPLSISSTAPLLVIGSLASWWSNTFLSTDATALFAGALSVYGLVWYLQRGKGRWLMILIAALLTLLKFQNFMVVGAVAIVIAMSPKFDSLSRERFGLKVTTWRSSITTALLMVTAAIFAQIAWMVMRNLLAVGESAEQGVSDPLTAGALLGEAVKFISGMAWGASTPTSIAGMGLVVGLLTTWLMIGGSVAASLEGRSVGLVNTLGFTWIAVSMIAGPLLAIATNAMVGYYFSLPVRYGMSLLPFGIAVAAIVFGSHRIWRVLFVAFALFATFAAFSSVLSL